MHKLTQRSVLNAFQNSQWCSYTLYSTKYFSKYSNRPSKQKFPKSGDWLWVPSKTGSFYQKTGRLEPKAKLWLAEPLLHCLIYIKGIQVLHTSSMNLRVHFSTPFWKWFHNQNFRLDVNKNPIQNRLQITGDSIRVFRYEKLGEMQKSRRIAKKTGAKGKETRRFDKFMITERFAFINRETRRYKPKPRDLEGPQ